MSAALSYLTVTLENTIRISKSGTYLMVRLLKNQEEKPWRKKEKKLRKANLGYFAWLWGPREQRKDCVGGLLP